MDFSKAYLLFGSEDYLILQAKKRLLEALLVRPDDMNFSSFTGPGVDVSAVSDAINTLPFFAERRVVLVENSGFFKTSDEAFLRVIENIPDTTVLICVEKDTDARLSAFKFFKKNYTVNEYNMLTGSDLEKWAIGKKIGGAGLKITRDAWQTFLDITTADKEMNNMMCLDNELEKLISYCYGKESITVEDVRTITSGYADDSVFELLDAIASSDAKRAMKLYDQMILANVKSEKILSMIIWEFKNIQNVGELIDDGLSPTEISAKTGMREWQIKKHKNAGHFKIFPPKRAAEALNLAVDTLYAIRRGTMDKQVGCEVLMVELCTK